MKQKTIKVMRVLAAAAFLFVAFGATEDGVLAFLALIGGVYLLREAWLYLSA